MCDKYSNFSAENRKPTKKINIIIEGYPEIQINYRINKINLNCLICNLINFVLPSQSLIVIFYFIT